MTSINNDLKDILIKIGLREEEITHTNYQENENFDSLAMTDLIINIEEKWGIEIDGEDIIPSNFKNIETISRLVEKYI